MYSHKYISRTRSFLEGVLGRRCLPIALVLLPKREKYKAAAEMDTVLAMTTAPSALLGHKKILCLLYMHLVKVQCIRGLIFERVRILSITGKWLIFNSLN